MVGIEGFVCPHSIGLDAFYKYSRIRHIGQPLQVVPVSFNSQSAQTTLKKAKAAPQRHLYLKLSAA